MGVSTAEVSGAAVKEYDFEPTGSDSIENLPSSYLSSMNSSIVGAIIAAVVTPYSSQNLRNNAMFDMTRSLNTFPMPISDPFSSSSGSMFGNNESFPYGTGSVGDSDDSSMDLPEKYTTLSERSRNCVIVYCIIFLIAAAGNLSVFFSVLHQLDKLKWRITVLILHLTIADLIVTFFVIPMEVFWRISIGWIGGIGGNALCKICQFFHAFGFYLSSHILIAIREVLPCPCLILMKLEGRQIMTFDRFFAIIFPLRMACAAKRVKLMLVMAWIMAALFALPQSFVFQVKSHPDYPSFQQCVAIGFFETRLQEILYNVFSVTVMFFFPLVVIIFTYGMILWKITTKSHEHRQAKNQNLHGGSVSGNCHLGSSDAAALLIRAKKRTLRLTLVIVVAFILCGSPYALITCWYMFDKEGATQINPALQDALFMMVVGNSCVNPIIYGQYTKKTLGKYMCPCSLITWRRSRRRARPAMQEEDEYHKPRTSDLIAVTSVI